MVDSYPVGTGIYRIQITALVVSLHDGRASIEKTGKDS